MYSERAHNHTWRKIKSALASGIAFVSALLVIAPLGLVFFHLLVNGAGSVNWAFWVESTSQNMAPHGLIRSCDFWQTSSMEFHRSHGASLFMVWLSFVSKGSLPMLAAWLLA